MSTNFEDLIGRGNTAGKPAAGIPGRLYFDTDESKLYRDNGSTWDEAEGAGGAGSDTTAIHDNVAGEINAVSEKVTPVDADLLIIEDSADSNNKKKIQIGNLPTGAAGAPLLPLDNIADFGSGDAFAGTSLDGGWSSLQSDALTSVDRTVAGFCILKMTGNATPVRGIQRAFSPAGDFTVLCKCNYASLISNYQWFGLFVGAADPSNGASGNRLDHVVVTNTAGTVSQIQWKLAKCAAGAETVVFSQLWGSAGTPAVLSDWAIYFPIWLRIRRTGSTLYAGISLDGVQFMENATTTTIAFTVATCGLLLGQATLGATIRATYDFIATTG